MADCHVTVEGFSAVLAQQEEDFVILGSLQPDRAHIRFLGKHTGHTVIWDAHVHALLHGRTPAAGSTAQFIDVGPPDGPLADISIGLAIEHIDLPVLRKTVIMIRNYRRLRPGRHEFGG